MRVCDVSSARIIGKIRGKGRPRVNTRTHVAYTDQATAAAERDVAQQYGYQTHTRPDWRGPVEIRLTVHKALVKSRPKRDAGTPATGKPDLDNILKLVCDALNGVAWVDDSQIVSAHVVKAPWEPYGSQEWIDVQVAYLVDANAKREMREGR